MAKQKLPFAQRAAYLGVGFGAVCVLLYAIMDTLFKHTSLGDRLGSEAVDVVLTWLTGGMFLFYVSALLVVVVYVIGCFLLGMYLGSKEGRRLDGQRTGGAGAMEDDDDEDGLNTPYSMSGLYPDEDMRSEPLLDDWNSNR